MIHSQDVNIPDRSYNLFRSVKGLPYNSSTQKNSKQMVNNYRPEILSYPFVLKSLKN